MSLSFIPFETESAWLVLRVPSDDFLHGDKSDGDLTKPSTENLIFIQDS